MKNRTIKMLTFVWIVSLWWISSSNAMMWVPTPTTWVSVTSMPLPPSNVISRTEHKDEWINTFAWGSKNFDESKHQTCKFEWTRSEWWYDQDWKLIKYDNCWVKNEPKKPNFTDWEYWKIKKNLYQKVKKWEISKDEMKNKIIEVKKNMKERYKEEYKKYKDTIENNKKTFKEEVKKMKGAFSELSKEVQEKIKNIREEWNKLRKEIIEKLKDKNLTLEKREDLRKEIYNINNNISEKIKELVSWNEKALKVIEKREELNRKNSILRMNKDELKKEYRWKRDELVQKYKKKFVSKLSSKITKLSTKKLEKVNWKIDKMIDKFEANTKISDSKKDKILAQLISLKELITEELDNREVINDEIDLDKLFQD